ncbi:hypothetical protein [Fibrobacter sp. UBA4309]|uniref:hypothetical protein n=1 Tax=Fibrobacter sp. UBA4309 TaxID=1946537 RepID=UPI0025C22CE9|nr:hypothetical protein [Fibrobacter sp. UBA4309]
MKKILALLVLALAMVGYAQEGSIKPKFQAFTGALLKLKPAQNGYHKFSLKVEAAPWAFQAIGEVRAPNGDPDLLINALFDGDVYAVLAYIDQPASGTDGQEYNVGLFDMMLYYDEEATTIRNLKFKLLPPANDDWAQGILSDALSSSSLIGNVWGGKYDGDIIKASANPMDKQKLKSMKKQHTSAEETMSDDNDRRSRMKSKAKAADDEPVVKKKKKKKAVEEDEEEDVPKKKKKKKKKKSVDEDECDDPSLSIKEKRRCRMGQR